MTIHFTGLRAETVAAIKAIGIDSNGQPIEHHHTPGGTWPCRHCLDRTSEDYLILAHRPFETLNPYTETGPIFLCAEDCAGYPPSETVPAIMKADAYIVRAYDAVVRIIYGTGKATPTQEIAAYAASLLNDLATAFVDVRSAANNCYQCRVVRA